MGLAQLAKQPTTQYSKDEEDARASTFKIRLAAQQFLKHHGPLLRAFVRIGGDSATIAQRGSFEERARQARTLAVGITARVMGKPADQVSMNDARHFRLEAAEVIAQAWTEGIDIDIDKMADHIASAVAGADDTYDSETIAWSQMSANGSAAMTAASVTLLLANVVSIYDFRVGQQLVLSALTAAVVEATRQAVDVMTTEQSTAEDRRSLSQTTMRAFTNILAQIYEGEARNALDQLVSLTEPRRRAWLRNKAPLENILGRFRTWTGDISQVAAAAARETMTSSRPPSNSPQV